MASINARSHDKISPQMFSRRISIQSPAYTDDGQGGQTVTWNTIYQCWADIPSMSRGRGLTEQFLHQQRYPQATKFIQIRYQPGIHLDGTMRIQYSKGNITHIFKITGPPDVFDESNRVIIIPVQEDHAAGIN